MANNKLPYTPQTISSDAGLSFSIPLYQRLFEWGDEQINQLLDDLYSSYQRNVNSPYYIGMLTSYKGGEDIELVDGQQRFTAMVLLGIHFGWNDFLEVSICGKKYPRLRFYARDEDKDYLACKIHGEQPTHINEKMEKGLECINTHIHKMLKLDGEEEKKFGDYIFRKLTFFLSQLPDEYTSLELNTYFERMNTSGKSLENYEILKVDVIKRLSSDKEKYTNLWNAVSIMEKKILRKHTNEQFDKLRERYLNAILAIIQYSNIDYAYEKPQTRFDVLVEDDDTEGAEDLTAPKTIAEIGINTENPFKIVKRRTEEHSLLTFPEFLLQVLYICLKGDIESKNINGEIVEGINTTDFFDVRKLGNTFKWAFEKRNLDAKEFMDNLALYRLLTDYFIIRMDDEDEDPYPFELYKADENAKSCVKKYLSMLYSASSAMTYYMWMPQLLLYLQSFVSKNLSLDLDGNEYLDKLKELDDTWHPIEGLDVMDLTYQTIDRYWFWRFDYYLWEKRDIFFKKAEQRNVAENYIFRRNRSIEHIAPQHPSNEYGDEIRFHWDDENDPKITEKRDCIGNMVMISSGQNSALTNSCYEVKRAVMEHFCNGVGNGHIESLKMLYVYTKYKNWSIKNIDDHQQFSVDFLNATYKKDNSLWVGLSER